jgi:LPS export ABC transporter protein LptC
MNPHSIKILRRWLIGIIICVCLAVASNYMLNRRRQSGSAKKPAKIMSPDITKTFEGIEYSDNKNGITRFKIHALRLVTMEGKKNQDGKSYLEGVKAYDFNPDGSIHNEIHSQKAVFDTEGKLVDFSGNVQLFVGKGVEIRTETLQYDLNTNAGSSPGLLQLYAQSASGKARGMRFNKVQESLELCSEVDFSFNRKVGQPGNPTEAGNMHATSERANFDGKQNHFIFQGKARIETKGSSSLSGNSIEVSLDAERKHVLSLTASGSAAYRTEDGGATRLLRGDRMLFSIGAKGALASIHVIGQSAFVLSSPTEEENLNGGQIDLVFGDKETISQIQGNDNVQFRMKRGQEQTLMSGGQLTAQFVPETGKLTNIIVVNNAKFSTEGAKDSASNELQSSDIRVSFKQSQERIAIEKIRADGSVHWLSRPPGNGAAKKQEPARKLDASLLEILYSNDGDYLQSGIASGKVVISESAGVQSGQPQIRHMLADSASFQFFQKNGQLKNMNAEGHVQTTYEGQKPDRKGGSTGENYRTASDKMATTFSLNNGRSAVESATQWGNFSYQDAAYSATAGRCDYDAGKEIMILKDSPRISDNMSSTTGNQVDYDQKQRTLLVHGNVQSRISPQKGGGSFLGSSSSASSSPSIIMADEMQYRQETGQFRYSGKVRAISENQQLHSQALEVFDSGERVEAQGDIWNLIKGATQSEKSRETQNTSQPSKRSKATQNSVQSPIEIRSEHLRYSKASNEIAYSGNVRVSSADVSLSSNNFDANLDQEGTIKHAIARGKVHIVQKNDGRESKSDVANWSLDADKFEIEGTPAEVFDPARGRSHAPRLTYFKADDRILLGK